MFSPIPVLFSLYTEGQAAHARSALDDIKASIAELKFYRDNIFIPLEPREPKKPKTDGPSAAIDSTEETIIKEIRKTAL